MRKTEIHKRNNGLKAAIISGLSGLMLALYGLYAPHAHAISVSPDMLESGMDILSLSADCAGENLSDNRLVCQDTLAEISRSHVAGKIADGVINTGMNQLGKLAGKLGMKTFSLATKGALRALGPTGKLMTSWEFGRMVGTQMSEQWVAPRIKQYLQKKAREEGKKIRQQTDLLKADKAVASEYRKLLMERGVDTANAYLDKQFEVASQPAGLKYDVQKELARGERMRKLAKEMDEDAARRRNMEREAQAEVSEIGGSESASITSDTGTGEFNHNRTPIEDEPVFSDEDLERKCPSIPAERSNQAQEPCSHLLEKHMNWVNALPKPFDSCTKEIHGIIVWTGQTRLADICYQRDMVKDGLVRQCGNYQTRLTRQYVSELKVWYKSLPQCTGDADNHPHYQNIKYLF